MEKIEKFIKENKLSFEGNENSDLNSDCCIISGFALHSGVSDVDDLKKIIQKAKGSKRRNFFKELERVFEFAQGAGYGSYWKTEQARKSYKF